MLDQNTNNVKTSHVCTWHAHYTYFFLLNDIVCKWHLYVWETLFIFSGLEEYLDSIFHHGDRAGSANRPATLFCVSKRGLVRFYQSS